MAKPRKHEKRPEPRRVPASRWLFAAEPGPDREPDERHDEVEDDDLGSEHYGVTA